jgi:hypothetical protein
MTTGSSQLSTEGNFLPVAYQLPDYFDLCSFYFAVSKHDVSPEECKLEKNLFLCANRMECVEIGELCDDVKHCRDGSDEGLACNASK